MNINDAFARFDEVATAIGARHGAITLSEDQVAIFASFFASLLFTLYRLERGKELPAIHVTLLTSVTVDVATRQMRLTPADIELLVKTANAT